MPHRLTRLLAAAALGLLAAPGPAASAAPPAVEPCRLTEPSGRRAVRAECARLTVPLDRSRPDGPQIELSVARVRALSRHPGNAALTVIAGGPGQSSLDYFAAYSPAFARMRETFDVLLVDQRGTGGSARLSCPTPSTTLGDIWSVEQTAEHARACFDTLEHDPRHFTTSVAVEDLDAVRAAFGYDALAVYGVSYGTRVAQHYLRRFPDRTHSVVLDGVVPVDEALGPGIALQAQQALELAFARCRASDACAEAFPGLEQRFGTLLAGLRETPVSVTLPDPLTAETMTVTLTHLDMAGAVRLLSYAPQTVALLPLFIEQAASGNYVPMTAQAVSLSRAMVDAMALGMHNAVVCTEDMPFVVRETQGLESTYLGRVMVESLRAICSVWPQGVIDADFKTPFASQVPVLVLSGEADPITPPHYGERVAGYLGNARHLVGRGQGHGLAPVGCVPQLMGAFARDRDPAGLDASCLERLGPEPFFTSFAGPQP